MKSAILSTLVGAAMLFQASIAHPGQSAEENALEIAERRAYLANNKRSLAHCAEKLKARGNDAAMHARRSVAVEKLRAKRAISQAKPYLRVRDVDSVLATSHASNLTGVTVDTDPSILFASNNSCILTPEVTQGPYWVQGELVRENVTENQEGVHLTLDIQIIDVTTCEPVPQAFLEIWHCNSTGVYSGVVANGNGNTNDTTNLDNTFLRGIQQSDDDGVVVFDTLFPGHYTGRAPHIHVMTSQDATVNANETLSGGSVTHVGQMFFDQDLISLVEQQEPYASNTQELTTNAEDSILAEEAATVDPLIEYVLLGDDVSEGLFGWLSFGMDTSNSFNITPAAYLTENGGVANANAGGGMGGGPPSGSGGPPSGVRPTGSGIPTGAVAAASTGLSTVVISSTPSVASEVASIASASVASEIASSASTSGTQSYKAAKSNAPQHGNGSPAKGHGQGSQRNGKQQQHQQHQQGPPQ
ncbi:aromatic compound dioxygenase [Cucurbitaria berberidis CBS 394.84]|uniref:Aromatic compound dioxygenase n=1 Tax=Cucurbitaria berberidis CBS 394.84 TaxID=1168544 RepID=A0A9P4GR94_9PLEO|nr:aromatic compound dioxygenase [Cucurbitaria berberidis CBS 394.84]KAF1849849.1 aromatic compound dioxygenase [Cucurbitaria berberidis CBS 394.84]